MASNFCKTCNVAVESDLENCPICGKFIIKDTQPSIFSYPKVDIGYYVKRQAVINFLKVIVFCGTIICFFINLFIGLRDPWFLYVLTGAALAYFTIFIPLGKWRFLWWELLLSIISICAYVMFIDFFASGMTFFSIVWVIPIIIGTGVLALSIYNLSASKSDPANTIPPLIVLLFFAAGFFVANIILAGINDKGIIVLPSFIVLMESGFFVLMLGILRRKALKKKFYL